MIPVCRSFFRFVVISRRLELRSLKRYFKWWRLIPSSLTQFGQCFLGTKLSDVSILCFYCYSGNVKNNSMNKYEMVKIKRVVNLIIKTPDVIINEYWQFTFWRVSSPYMGLPTSREREREKTLTVYFNIHK